MSKFLAFVSNNVPQNLTSGSNVAPGTAIHGYGGNCCTRAVQINGNNIAIKAKGYASIILSATVSNSATGNVTISLYQDGTLLAAASTAIATADTPAVIAFPAAAIINCNSTFTITVTASTGDPIVNSVNMTIEGC